MAGASPNNYGSGGYGGNSSGDGDTGSIPVGGIHYVGKGASSSLTSVVTTNDFPIEEDPITGIENIYEYENGTLGSGGDADYLGAGAGGGGFVGGSASHDKYAGGGGGSSYIYNNDLTSLSTIYPEITSLESIYDGVQISNGNIINGLNMMDSPLKFLGVGQTRGNQGYGYIIIKKVS